MRNYCAFVVFLIVSACTINQERNVQATKCSNGVPLFTAEIGKELIDKWGRDLKYYAPNGQAGYTDSNIGAAYFVGTHYLPNATLVPTLSPRIRYHAQDIYAYFTHFLSKNPQMLNNQIVTESGEQLVSVAECGFGVISGYYDFSLPSQSQLTNGRYTIGFSYLPKRETIIFTTEDEYNNKSNVVIDQESGWYILFQNSSRQPADMY